MSVASRKRRRAWRRLQFHGNYAGALPKGADHAGATLAELRALVDRVKATVPPKVEPFLVRKTALDALPMAEHPPRTLGLPSWLAGISIADVEPCPWDQTMVIVRPR